MKWMEFVKTERQKDIYKDVPYKKLLSILGPLYKEKQAKPMIAVDTTKILYRKPNNAIKLSKKYTDILVGK